MGDRGNVFAASASSIGLRFRYRGVSCEERIKLAPTPRNMAFARNLRGRIMPDGPQRLDYDRPHVWPLDSVG